MSAYIKMTQKEYISLHNNNLLYYIGEIKKSNYNIECNIELVHEVLDKNKDFFNNLELIKLCNNNQGVHLGNLNGDLFYKVNDNVYFRVIGGEYISFMYKF